MNINGEDLGELGGLGDVLPAEVLKKLNEVLERLHQTDHHHGGNIINIYASGSQHVDRVEKQYIYALERPLPRPLPREGGENGEERLKGGGEMREGYSDVQIARAIEAICGDGKALDTKQKWAGVHWLLRWECNYPARPKEFCERIATLPLREDLAYKCDYRNIREISTLSFLNEDPRQMERVRYSKNDEAVFLQLREVVQALQRELQMNE